MPIGNPISLTDNVASKIITATATAAQTIFTVNGGYRINAISVFQNGVRLTEGTDFTASDGSTVVLTSSATGGDELTFQIFDDFRVADAIVSAASTQTLSGNLVITGELYADIAAGQANIGIQSAGVLVGTAKTLNFVGTGNTFLVNGDTIDISISGGGGGGGVGTAINYDSGDKSPFSYINASINVVENIVLDTENAGTSDTYIVVQEPTLIVNAGIAVTVGAGKTLVQDLYQLGDL
jgi:hypothetical protein